MVLHIFIVKSLVVTLRTTRRNIKNSAFCLKSIRAHLVKLSQRITVISSNNITSLVLLVWTVCVPCEVGNNVLGAFAKLRKVTNSLVMFVCPSVRPSVRMELDSHWTDFQEIWYLCVFRKSVTEIWVTRKYDNNNGYFTRIRVYISDNISLSSCNEKCFNTKFVQKIKTHILCSTTFFWKSYPLWDNVENVCRPLRATDDNMAHALCIVDNLCYTCTLNICNTYCLSTAKVGTRTRHNVTLQYTPSLVVRKSKDYRYSRDRSVI
jgi:hypothetical protein